MKKLQITFIIIFSAITTIGLFAFKAIEDPQVKGWLLAGSYPKGYAIGIESNTERNGHVAFLKSTESNSTKKFGTIMQAFIPDEYLGKRVRLTGYIKSADVKGWAGMWFRIDGEPAQKSLGFDNMQNRPIKGTTEWKKYEIILDVPVNSKDIAYGVLLTGSGTVWLDDLHFEIVPGNTAATNMMLPQLTNKPQNTSFEDATN